MKNKFQIIVADPPWSFQDSLKMDDVKRGAESNYNTMSISQIKEIRVREIVDPNGAILALWVPSSLLQEGLDVMKAWGFAHKQTYIWVKNKKDPFILIKKEIVKLLKDLSKFLSQDNKLIKKLIVSITDKVNSYDINNILAFGMGRLFRQTHELCLIGINSKKIYKKLKNKSQRSVSFGVNLKHSAKPEHLQNSLEIMFPGVNKLEMFARRLRPEWTCIGNEVCNGEDISVSLAKLI